jgi:tripartite-type tricarboxylate transporter receptor subunit TctC
MARQAVAYELSSAKAARAAFSRYNCALHADIAGCHSMRQKACWEDFMPIHRTFAAAIFAAAAIAVTGPHAALSFPTQRVTIIVPFGAGSVTDIMARIVADETSRRWGQQVIVENRPGIAGTASVAKSPPDGYTLMVTSNGHTVLGLVNKNLPFDPVKDFAGITRVSSAPLCLIVNPDLSAKNLKEVLDLAKAKPGTLNFSSPGLASTTFIAGALFRKAAGINIVHVPFKSAPDAVTAVVRGDAQLYFAPVNLSKEMAEGGKVRAIAVPSPTRLPEIPDVPTFREAGLDFVYDSWFGLMTQAAVPREIISKINQDVVSILQTPEVKAKLAAQFLVGASDTPEQFDKVIRDETVHLTEVFKEITN